MLNHWVSFVRTGIPAAPGETAWPRFAAKERGYLDIGFSTYPSHGRIDASDTNRQPGAR